MLHNHSPRKWKPKDFFWIPFKHTMQMYLSVVTILAFFQHAFWERNPMPLVPRISAGDLPKVLRKSHRSSTNHQSSILKEPHQKFPFETGEDCTYNYMTIWHEKTAKNPSQRIWRGQVDVEFEEYAVMKCHWLKSDSNQRIPEACQRIRWTRLLRGNQWILGPLSDLKQPWLDVTGETRACSTCNWRSMHECSVGWL